MKPTRHQDKIADIERTLETHMVFQCFCCVGSALLHPIFIKNRSQEIDAKSIENRSNKLNNIGHNVIGHKFA